MARLDARRSAPVGLIVVGSLLALAAIVIGRQSGRALMVQSIGLCSIGLIVAQVGAFLVGTDWLGATQRLGDTFAHADRFVRLRRLVRANLGLAAGSTALVLTGVTLAVLIVDRPIAATSIVLAGMAVSRDVVIDPAHRVAASARTIASVLVVASLSFGGIWQLSAVVVFLILAGAAFVQTADSPTILPALWQVVLGIVAIGLILTVFWLAILLSETAAASLLLAPAMALAVAAIGGGMPGLRRQASFDFRRTVEFDRGWSCAEIDTSGRLISVNDEWTAEVGDQSLEERLDSADWIRMTAALVQAQLGQEPSRMRSKARTDDDTVTVDSFEIMPGPPGSSVGLIQLRVERQAVTAEELETLRSQANTDALTGLLNRRGLEAAMADRLTDGYHLVFADLNGFKTVNDYLGHEAGDDVLTLVASRLKATCRDDDCVARLGGDEFVVVIETELSESRFRRIVEAMSFTYKGYSISASVGVAEGDDGTPYDEILALADARMYEAKRRSKAQPS